MYHGLADHFKALADPMRLHILSLLRVREACVCELASLLPVSQPAVSQHLRKLHQAGCLQERRYKYWTYYRIHPDLPSTLRQLLEEPPLSPEEEKWLTVRQAEMNCADPSASVFHSDDDLLTAGSKRNKGAVYCGKG